MSRSINSVAVAGALVVVFWSLIAAVFPQYHPSVELVSATSVLFNSAVGYFVPDSAAQIDAAHAELHAAP
jgi:hypothetical protein